MFLIVLAVFILTSLVSGVSAGRSVSAVIEHSLPSSTEFSRRNEIIGEAMALSTGSSRWSVKTLSSTEPTVPSQTFATGLYTVRTLVDPSKPEDGYVFSSVPACLISANNFKHDIFLFIAPDNTVRSIDIRLPEAGKSCDVAHSGPVILKSHYGIISGEESVSIPLVPVGAAAPYPGQKVVVNADKPLKPGEAPIEEVKEKSFLQKYWPYLVGAYLLMQFVGSQAPTAPANNAAAGGAAQRQN